MLRLASGYLISAAWSILASLPVGVTSRHHDYVALLYSSAKPDMTCIAAIITDLWVVDCCPDQPEYKYDALKAGWINTEHHDVYGIAQKVRHEDYNFEKFTVTGYDNRNLYSTVHGLYLHKTNRSIVMWLDVVGTIGMHSDLALPKRAHALYVYNDMVYQKTSYIVDHGYCNEHFKPYFNHEVRLGKYQFCVNSEAFTYKQCCLSQSLMVWGDELVGVMAWSTICSRQLGVDPWVFSRIAHYKPWIAQHTNYG